MPKQRYHFNENTLTFSEHKKSFGQKVRAVAGYLFTSAIFALGFLLVFSNFFDSPKERRLKRENAELRLQYEIVDKQINDISSILTGIQERDDNIYRAVFEAKPIPSTIRDAGFGGANRYEDLKKLEAADLVIDTRKKLDVITKKLYVQSNSFDEIVALAGEKEKMLMSTPSIMPIASTDLARVASGWGWRIHPIDKVSKFHYGMDFTAATGTNIYVTGNGVVERVYSSSTYGKAIVINHGYNYKTLYAHLSGFNVKEGERVVRGQVIGFVGNTGRSSGAHLHYEVHYKGARVNPQNYYFNDLTPEQYEEMIAKSAEYGQSLD